MFAELSLRIAVDGSLKARTHSASSIVWRFVRIVYASASHSYIRGLHALRSPTALIFSSKRNIDSFFDLLTISLAFCLIVLNVIPIDHHIEAACTYLGVLSENNTLWDSLKLIYLWKYSCAEQNISCFLEACLTQNRDISDSIDSVSVDSCQVSSGWHPVSQHWQVTLVYINVVRFQNLLEFVDKSWTGCLYSQNIENLRNIVAVRFVRIDFEMRKNFS